MVAEKPLAGEIFSLSGEIFSPSQTGGLGMLRGGTPRGGPAPAGTGGSVPNVCVPPRGTFHPQVTEIGWKQWLCHPSPTNGTLLGWV